MPPTINIAERRPHRDPIVITDGDGHSYEWPSVVPTAVTIWQLRSWDAGNDPRAAADSIRPAFAALFGEDHADEAMQLFNPREVSEIVTEVYRIEAGESSASPDS